MSPALPLLVLALLQPALPPPKKVLVDDKGKALEPAALVLEQVKVDGWSPAKGRIEAITTRVVLPRQKGADGRFVVPDEVLVGPSEKGATTSTGWSGEMAR